MLTGSGKVNNVYQDRSFVASIKIRNAFRALEKVVSIALTQADPIQVLNETLWMWFGPSPGVGVPCIDYKNLSAAAELGVPLIEHPIFRYLTCMCSGAFDHTVLFFHIVLTSN